MNNKKMYDWLKLRKFSAAIMWKKKIELWKELFFKRFVSPAIVRFGVDVIGTRVVIVV